MSTVSDNKVLEEIQIVYVDPVGKSHRIEATEGETLMSIARCHSVDGVDGDCGGNGACGTCTVQLQPAVMAKLTPPTASELELLDFLGVSSNDHRLGCQVKLNKSHQGITIKVASVS
jgi:2Fe-2S ferredoxin